MTAQKDIQATEKLLEVIRNPKTDPGPKPEPATTQRFSKLKNKKKQILIGVEIDGHTVRLAAISHAEPYRLLGYQQVSLPITRDKESLGAALAPVLRKFCAPFPKKKLWHVMDGNNIDPLYCEIPHVEPKKLDSVAFLAAQKEKKIDTSTHIFDYHILGEKTEGEVKKYRVLAYTVPKKEVEEWKTFFRKIGYSLEGITISTFCLQNMLQTKWIDAPAEGSAAHIFIDEDRSRIDIFHNKSLVFSRDVKTGLNSLLSEIQSSFQPAPQAETDVTNGSFNLELQVAPEALGGSQDLTLQQAKEVLQAQMVEGQPLPPDHPGSTLDAEQVLNFVRPAIDRLLRQLQRTVSHYNNTMALNPVEKIFITGTMSLYLPLLAYLQEEFGLDIEACDPFQDAAGHLKTIRPPATITQRVLFLPVIGLALSTNPDTPNFLYTYKDKNEEKKLTKIRKGILATGCLTFFLFLGLNIAAFIYLSGKQTHLASLNENCLKLESKARAIEDQISSTDPNVDLSNIRQLAEKINLLNSYLEYSAKRYAPVAVFSELLTLTPEGISIHKALYSSSENPVSLVYKSYKGSVQSNPETKKFTSPFGFFDIEDNASKSQSIPSKNTNFILLDGIITTQEQDKNLYLSVYKMILNNSPLFEVIEVEKNSQITPGIGNSLYFTLAIKVTL